MDRISSDNELTEIIEDIKKRFPNDHLIIVRASTIESREISNDYSVSFSLNGKTQVIFGAMNSIMRLLHLEITTRQNQN